MNALDTRYRNAGEESEHNSSSPSTHYWPQSASFNERLTELKVENLRLHRLVAELLIKNQQLRKLD
jgi:hypothetical protein